MTITPENLPFAEALRHLGDKTAIGSRLTSREWRDKVAVALRERAFFSARIENARVLQTMQDYIGDFLQKARDPAHGGLKAQGRAEFVAAMRELCQREGLGKLDPITGKISPEIDDADITDIRSIARLQLIFDTQTEQAYEYGYWAQGNDPDILAAFPAQRFIRVRPVKVPRPYHAAAEGTVRRKDDLDFWLSMNPDFGVPYGPWGFNSGMGVEDVGRREAQALGLIEPGEKITPPDRDLNTRLSASVRDFSPEIMQELRDVFGEQVKIENGKAWWTGIAPKKSAPQAPQTSSPKGIDSIVNAVLHAVSTEEALQSVEIPHAKRGTLIVGKTIKSGNTPPLIAAGSRFIERVIHPDWLKTTPVNFQALPKNSRASYSPLTKTAKITANVSTIIHEVSHHLEMENPNIYQACKDFRKSRTKGDPLKKLSKLTGNKRHKAHEEAYEDEWKKRGGSHYMGRSYARWGLQTTEILTMGMERLFNTPVEFAKNDPEYFRFLIGLLQKL